MDYMYQIQFIYIYYINDDDISMLQDQLKILEVFLFFNAIIQWYFVTYTIYILQFKLHYSIIA